MVTKIHPTDKSGDFFWKNVEPGKTPGLAIITMEDELSNIINRQIDLRTPGDLSRYFREQVLAEAMVIYEKD